MKLFRSVILITFFGLVAWMILLPASPVHADPSQEQSNWANIIFGCNRDVVNVFVQKCQVKPEVVDEVILGTPVHGCGISTAWTSADLIPSEDRACIELVVNGYLDARTSATKGPVTVFNKTRTTFQVRKPLFLTGEGLSWTSAGAWANVDSDLERMKIHRGGLVGAVIRLFAERIYERDKPKAKEESECKARRKLVNRVNEESEKELFKANCDFQEKLLAPMSKAKDLTNPLCFRTMPDLLLGFTRFADRDYPLHITTPPVIRPPFAVMLLLHDSVLTTGANRLLAGKSVNREKIEAELKKLGLPVQDSGEESKEEKEDTEITFAAKDPLRVRFAKQRIGISLRITGFKREDGTSYNRPWDVRIIYRLSREGKGLRLDLDGAVKPIPLDPTTMQETQMSGIRIAERRVLIRLISKRLKESYSLKELKPKDDLAKLGTLVSEQAVTQDGWLLLTWQREPNETHSQTLTQNVLPAPAPTPTLGN